MSKDYSLENSQKLLMNSPNLRTLEKITLEYLLSIKKVTYEILNTWNNLPNDMKDIPATHSKSKSMISNFIKNEYELCTTKNCKSCEVTPFEDIMSNINELRILFS